MCVLLSTSVFISHYRITDVDYAFTHTSRLSKSPTPSVSNTPLSPLVCVASSGESSPVSALQLLPGFISPTWYRPSPHPTCICGIHQSHNPIYRTISSHRSMCHPRCEKKCSAVEFHYMRGLGLSTTVYCTFLHLSAFIETAVNVIYQKYCFSCQSAARLVL